MHSTMKGGMSKVILSECFTKVIMQCFAKNTAQSLGSIHRGRKATYRLLLEKVGCYRKDYNTTYVDRNREFRVLSAFGISYTIF